ncbi:MAG TPA: hypothetical protein P5341_01210 [Hyphomonas sp.]|nr:hypothetical protein [Hyphomonas sp.]
MQDATPDDHGAYALAGGVLTFTSKVDPRFSQSLPYELHDDRLKIFIAPFPGAGANPPAAEWRRSDALPAFQTRVFAGDELPFGLPGMVAAAMASLALPWQSDAQPVSLEVEISPPGRGVNVRLRFFSPAANEGLQLNITKYTISSRTLDGARMERRPLPADFTDLAIFLEKAASDSLTGKFRRADLRTYENAGPAWMISPEGPRGATYSAITGERIHGDVTGYIAQYEADWAKNAAIWRQVIAQQKNDGDDLKKAFDKAQDKYDQGICERDHGNWRDGACYEH